MLATSRPLPAADPLGTTRAAREAQATWALTPLTRRLPLVRRLRHLLARHVDRLEAAAGREGVDGQAETLAAEIIPLLDALRFLEREATEILAPRRLGARGRPAWLMGTRAEVRREPLGVVLVIAPSNYPLLLPGVQVMQALVAGNAVLVKPAPGCEAPMQLLAVLLRQCGLIPGLLQVLPSTVEAGRAACTSGIDKVVLTGSAVTGRAVLTDLAAHVVPSTMELSGSDAVFILPGADLDLVGRALRFGLAFNGSATCIAPRRVFVPRSIADDFETRLVGHLADLPPRRIARSTGMHLRRLVAMAREHGARLICGDDPRETVTTPLVLADVRPHSAIVRSDVFAPVLSLIRVQDEEEALELDALCPYALGASVFGETRAARTFAGRIRAGSVVVNDLIVPTADPRLPFGGRGESGFGVTRGPEGLLEMTTPKSIVVRYGSRRPHLDRSVGGEANLFRAWVKAAHADTWRQRIGGWVKLIRAGRALARARSSQGETR